MIEMGGLQRYLAGKELETVDSGSADGSETGSGTKKENSTTGVGASLTPDFRDKEGNNST